MWRTDGDGLEIRLLGDFEVIIGGRVVTPSAPKLRQILAVLVLRRNQIVPADTLIDELWGSRPPRSAVAALHTHMYELRKELYAASHTEAARFVHTRAHGYLAQVRPEDVDLTRFDRRVAEGAAALAGADPAAARELLAGALSLYQGRALANVRCGELLAGHVTRLEESRLRALELRIEADFQLSRHHELIGELKTIVADHPFHEGFYEKLMVALYRSGRRNEALDAYHQLRQRLVDELGLEPGPGLQRLQRALVAADPQLDPVPDQVNPLTRVTGRPAQLPPDIPDFTARSEFLSQAGERLRPWHETTAPSILLIRGMPGVGKTTTAVHLAHAVRDLFPDGQFFASLGGSDPVPANAADVVAVFLRACGVAPGEVPDSAAERTAAFRTWSADRRALVVLDDADSAGQVQALLPGGPGCAVVITSRGPLYGLPGLETSELGTFDIFDGLELLGRIIGSARVSAEPAAAAEIVHMVGGLPLAIRLIGQRLTAFPMMRLRSLLVTLSGTAGRHPLSELSTIGAELYARLEASYRKLSEPNQRAFGSLALLDREQFTAEDAATVFGVDPVTAEMALMRLADANFVQAHGVDRTARQRYALHELLRRFSAECLMAGFPADEVGCHVDEMSDGRVNTVGLRQ